MPALPPVVDVARFRILWSDAGDLDVSSTMYFHYSGGPPSESDAATLASEAFDAFSASPVTWNTDVQLTGVEVTDLSEESGAQAVHSGSVVGTLSGEALAGGSCVVTGYQIARRYRGGKPRNYWPWGSGNTLLSPQQWTDAFITLVGSTLSGAISGIVGSTGGSTTITNHANVSYYKGNDAVINPRTGRAQNFPVLRDTPVVDTITSLTVRVSPGSQRRRNRV